MTNAIIFAYKDEKAMKSATPVYLHDLLDKPMLNYVIDAFGDTKPTLFVDDIDAYEKYTKDCNVVSSSSDSDVYQNICGIIKQKGFTVICNGNTPTITNEHISQLVNAFEKTNIDVVSLTYNLKPTGAYCISNQLFTNDYETLTQLLDNNEVGNCDVIADDQFYPIINRYHLSLMENDLRKEIIKKHLFNGVSVKNMESVTIGPDVEIDEDTIIFPNTYITGKVKIGKGCKLGPFVRIRQKATLGDGVKLGNFVELKNATMDDKSASAHLSYLGDTTIGKKVNIGCGVITVNYDGANKHHTTIEDEAFIGCNTNLIAPITVGSDALVAAGSTVTKDVPAKSLCFARARQVNKEGYKRPKKQ